MTNSLIFRNVHTIPYIPGPLAMFDYFLQLCAILLIITALNLIVLASGWFITQRISRRAGQVLVPLFVMLAGYLLLMKADPANLVLGTHFFVLPMALLLVVLADPHPEDPESPLTRLILADVFATIIAVVVLGFVLSSGSLNTVQYYRTMAFSNAMTYLGVFVFDLILALLLFGLMRMGRRYPVQELKEP